MATLILAIKQDYFKDEALDLIDRLILSYVSTWEEKGKLCYAKDQFFSQLFNVKQEVILSHLVILEARGYITQTFGMGGRIIKTVETVKKQVNTDLDIFEGLY
jgi:hypothetical protein